MRVTFGSGNSRQSVTLPCKAIRNDNDRDMAVLVNNIEERVLPPSVLLERKGFRVYGERR